MPFFVVIASLIKITSQGNVLHVSKRIGKNGKLFFMPKFRTMVENTPLMPPYYLKNPEQYYTNFGRILRRYYLDELPQLFTILTGEMSFVGPRPGLAKNEDDLIEKRKIEKIEILTPGLTGWAQIKADGNAPIDKKVNWDKYYLKHRSFWFDIKIMLLTAYVMLINPKKRKIY